ncbi:RNA 2'-phosphotransferase [Chryseobacterium indologenes]|uniref:RNA 2'-phosphotransferase n=1 Tax=Chryseobacterium indologenes TaxID=253 RepID=UPI000BFDC979|nr:RNA 2'-phosphotransferase [Chryseobacterium indologenes]ATN07149.1 RNA 2'-phosphotransferase [Chryseobacterium indologenes]AYY84103.1 RNA 2'-phosphotransferase [Chryseobacterium indologenes]QIX81053.1 RNA 2'-phosphotransferase [Chryseobacterium indologenes]UDQ54741.1 RNA 2'-phosphotransferase [Chryseobacterium indologenes]HAO27106.1 RNA 2'-phosphotransferase [Chryseobacterium indologenes]
MNEIEKKKISKFLSLILRHQPESIGLILDENGWAHVDELRAKSALKRMFFSFDELEEVVETNNKKRFAFNDDKTKIRASQGHSIDIDLALKAQQPPDYLYHGTAETNIVSILGKGIEKRNRQHVHLSADKETATKVGMRHGKPVILTVRTGKMYEDGLPFYLSANGVWLTDFVDPQYISK